MSGRQQPALTEQQMEDATAKALISFNKKHLQVRKLNAGKVIVVSITTVSEGLHPSTGYNVWKTIVKEMQQASLFSTGMANVIRLVICKGAAYYESYR